MRILIKYPTRQRPQIFLTRLREWIGMAAQPALLSCIVSYDSDDATMTPEVIEQACVVHPGVLCISGESKSKIHAVNRDIERAGDWDVLIVISDDMFCRRVGWDDLIRQNMADHFPDCDGALWFYDGAQKKINTLEVVGRKRYQQFGYIYHPSYRSFFSDNESTAVGIRDHKLAFVDTPICTHEHPSWCGGMKRDALYERNNAPWKHDEALFAKRKAAGFPLGMV